METRAITGKTYEFDLADRFRKRHNPKALANLMRIYKDMDMSKQPLSTAEVAHLFQVDVSTISYWVRTGRIKPSFRLPGIRGAMFFDRADVDTLARATTEELRARLAHMPDEQPA